MAASALRHAPDPATPQVAAAAPLEVGEWIAAALPAAAEGRHSHRVALLKRVLPAIGVALLLLVAVWPRLAPLWDRMRFAVPAIDLREARELRMVNPRYTGADRLGRPFVVTATVGRQVPGRQDLMSLDAPRAELTTHAGADIAVSARSGIYQAQAQLLDLTGEVTLARQNGDHFVTDRARVDAAGNVAEGNDPVIGQGPSGDIRAEGFRVLDRGNVIILTGKSQLQLRQAKAGTAKAEPAALPAPVALAAAQIGAPRAGRAVRAAPPARATPPAQHASTHAAAAERKAR